MIILVNFDLVNSDFSFYLLKLALIDSTPSDPQQKSIFEIVNSIRSSDFRPFCKD